MTGRPIVDSSAAIENIPEELRELKGWLVWRSEGGNGASKPLKVPYYPDGTRRRGEQGSAADRAHLGTWEEATAQLANGGGWSGLGFAMLADWGLVGLDFDDCFDADGRLCEGVASVVAGGYAEKSPSGRGLHALMWGAAENRKALGGEWPFKVEAFSTTGYLTMTGDVLDGAAAGIGEISDAAMALIEERWGQRAGEVDLAWDGWAGARAGAGAGEGLDAEVLSALAVLNAGGRDLDYDVWIRVLLALHHVTGGSGEGLRLMHEVSSRSVLYDPTNVDYQWSRAHSTGRARVVGRGSIVELARQVKWGGGWTDAVALDSGAFELVVPDMAPVDGTDGAPDAAAAPLDLPPFKRDRKGGIEPSVDNAVMALARPDFCGWCLGWDEYRDEMCVADWAGQAAGQVGPGWRPMTDADLVRLRQRLEQRGFKTAPRDLIRDAALLVAAEGSFDSARVWLDDVVPAWDGVPRIARFLVDRFGAVDDAAGYVRAVGRYLWTALAGRVLKGGEWVDMVPVLLGAQGIGKSKALGAMVPDPRYAIEASLMDKDDDLARRMRGVLVVELAELHGLRARDMDGVKRFITRTHENWIPKYKEFATVYARRCVMVGTANPGADGFLADDTGERRWAPVDVTRADVAGIERDREQLWAEARDTWRAGGVAWADVERLAGPAREANKVTDDWDEPIARWLGSEGGGKDLTTTSGAEVASGALGIAPKDLSKSLQMRIAAVLCRLGWERKTLWFGGAVVKRWERKT